ncbi:hypothetical protein PCASD_15463 [Puccinia coronata f. sp. avenae]|uniref:Uncharacterized protein n=1 Tax=Puccinia coronata f. sp. avenae TaxID=200324 RepID=A0A2N5UPH2_9BASI|nr:hypothetical protein PCASD_15463 [Puccinia coronata f. sp. avenae]
MPAKKGRSPSQQKFIGRKKLSEPKSPELTPMMTDDRSSINQSKPKFLSPRPNADSDSVANPEADLGNIQDQSQGKGYAEQQLVEDVAILLETLPEELDFFVARQVDVKKKNCTKQKQTNLIQHFDSLWKPPKKFISKGTLVAKYSQDVKPLIDLYLDEVVGSKNSEDGVDAESEGLHGPSEPQLNLIGINPNNANITVDIIREMISERRPNVKLPESLTKYAAIVALHQYICPPPPGGIYLHASTLPASAIPAPYHRYLTLQGLRYGLHHFCPAIFIPSVQLRLVVISLYKKYVQEVIPRAVVFEGVHYFIQHSGSRADNQQVA